MYTNVNFDALDLKILDVLKTNGFSVDDMGTFFYKEVIKKAVFSLMDCQQEMDITSLQQQIVSPYSLFYYDIITKFNGINLESFHAYIKEAVLKSKMISKKQKAEKCYMPLAFYTASYMLSLLECEENEMCEEPKILALRNNNK